MNGNKTINKSFKRFEKDSKYKIINRVMGSQYNFRDKYNQGEIIRFFIDKYLDASISKIQYKDKKTYLCEYVDKSDLLIIGFCLNDKISIDYNGEKIISKGEVFYLRPKKDFTIKFTKNEFLYYIIDLNNFKESLHFRPCRKFDSISCNSYIDYICKKNQIAIEEAPYILKASIEEIREIRITQTNNFLDYTNIKGQLFNYLTCLLRVKLDTEFLVDSKSCNKRCKKHECKCYHVAETKKIIIDNLDKHVSVKEIADRLDISTYILQKSFKKIEGTTVYDFILKVKIDNSKVFLKNTQASILEISQKVGYENPSKFSTTFKRITGYTPTEYRGITED